MRYPPPARGTHLCFPPGVFEYLKLISPNLSLFDIGPNSPNGLFRCLSGFKAHWGGALVGVCYGAQSQRSRSEEQNTARLRSSLCIKPQRLRKKSVTCMRSGGGNALLLLVEPWPLPLQLFCVSPVIADSPRVKCAGRPLACRGGSPTCSNPSRSKSRESS